MRRSRALLSAKRIQPGRARRGRFLRRGARPISPARLLPVRTLEGGVVVTFTLIVFLLTVVLGPNNIPTSIVRTAQQTPGYATGAACEADAATKQVAKIPGVVFWMCMGTGSG